MLYQAFEEAGTDLAQVGRCSCYVASLMVCLVVQRVLLVLFCTATRLNRLLPVFVT
jgi:hypothetical protein